MLDKQKLAYKTARLLGGGIGQKRAAAALCALLAVVAAGILLAWRAAGLRRELMNSQLVRLASVQPDGSLARPADRSGAIGPVYEIYRFICRCGRESGNTDAKAANQVFHTVTSCTGHRRYAGDIFLRLGAKDLVHRVYRRMAKRRSVCSAFD